MKNSILFTMLASAILSVLVSCGDSGDKIAATGKPYELFVVSSKDTWGSTVGDSLKSIFKEEVMWLNQPEPIYDLYNTPPASMENLTKRHRNLFFVNIDPKLQKTSFTVENDKYAQGQLLLDLSAPSIDSAVLYLNRYRQTIVDLLDKTERERFVARTQKYGTQGLEELITKKFGFHLGIPRGFRLRVDADNFLWLSNELPLASQGIVIYTFPIDESADSTWFVMQRNAAVGKIPGPVEGSYMSTDLEFYPETLKVHINGRDWYETRGFWNVKGDFMGGPFANFVTILHGQVIAIDMYVQSPSPKYGKRNYIRQLEALPYTAKFDIQKLEQTK